MTMSPHRVGRVAWLAAFCAIGVAASAHPSTEETPLTAAVRAGDRDAVSALLADGSERADVNASEVEGTTALHWAVRRGDADVVELLVRAGANPNSVTRYGVTPLSMAAQSGNAVLLERLLVAGADAEAAERVLPEGQTLAMLAARTGSVESLGVLFGAGALDVNARESRNETTALMWAALADRADAVRFLAEVGAELDIRSKLTDYPHLPNGVLRTGLEEGVSFVGQTPLQRGGWTALMYAARQGSVEATRALAASGANLDLVDPLGATALSLAIINGHWDVMAALLEAGADPDVADMTGMTPLYAAVDFHTLPDTYGRPAPEPRVVVGSVRAAEALLAAGADVDARLVRPTLRRKYTGGDRRLGEGATPLMRAAWGGDVAMMRVLLGAGAEVSVAQANGTTALLIAAGAVRGSAGEPDQVTVERAIEAVGLCLDAGADVNAVNADGRTAVHLAVTRADAPEMIRFLVDHGARVDVEDGEGRTPLQTALRAREPDEATVAVLQELAP